MAVSVDDLAHHAQRMGTAAADAKRKREATIRRIVAETRRFQGLPPTIKDAAVLESLAELLADANNDDTEALAKAARGGARGPPRGPAGIHGGEQ